MSAFLHLLIGKDKAPGLNRSCNTLRANIEDARIFQVAPESFQSLSNARFDYWPAPVSEKCKTDMSLAIAQDPHATIRYNDGVPIRSQAGVKR
jgi:hypothetical protein